MPLEDGPEKRNEPIQIKRYANRKLYDLSARRYIALDGVGRLVEEGHDICVTDNQTGQDVTVLVLSQIIVEQAKSRPESLPGALLSGLIRARSDALDFVGRLAGAPLALFAPAQGRDGEASEDGRGLYDVLRLATRDDVTRLTDRVNELIARLDILEGTPRKSS